MHVAINGVSKNFGSLRALRDVTLQIRSGTVHALVGENGAGKSTLMKIIAGAQAADSGSILVNGQESKYRSPADALADGITIIAQELSLEPGRTIEENVFLGTEPARWGQLNRRAMRRRYFEVAAQLGFDLPPDAKVRGLRTADQQKVEILRAIARRARLVIMDEPTAALTTVDAARLLETVRTLRSAGTTIVYVSHFLPEVLAIADDVTILRDGQSVRTAKAAEETPASLIASMLGQASDLTLPDPTARPDHGEVVLSVRGLTRTGKFSDIGFDLHAGEIVGLAGLIGSGRSEVARGIFGADRTDAGTVSFCGRVIKRRSPRKCVSVGISMLPESRKEQGLVMRQSITDNVVLPHLDTLSHAGIVNKRSRDLEARRIVSELDVRGAGPHADVHNLSGGNQQKTLFAKWLLRRPKVLIIDEPTRGVDVGAKFAIYGLIDALAREGMAVLLISSEIEEVMGLSNRILVMRNGTITTEFEHGEASEDAILRAAFGTAAGTETE